MFIRNQTSDGERELKLVEKKIEEVFPENDAEWTDINKTVLQCMKKSEYVSSEST